MLLFQNILIFRIDLGFQEFKVSITDIVKIYKKEMAMLMQWQKSNTNRDYQFILAQIIDYGQGILGDRR
jgi:hypothetical protein